MQSDLAEVDGGLLSGAGLLLGEPDPDGALAPEVGAAVVDAGAARAEAEHPAHDEGLLGPEVVVAHRTPHAVVTDLNAPGGRGFAVGEASLATNK